MLSFTLALAPILVILILMVGFRWGAARAGSAGYLSALVIAVISFGVGPELLAYAHAKALLLALDVLLIIWGAFLLYRVVDEAGAIRVIGRALPHLTPDRAMQAVIIGWVFASFLQGVGGFGVPVAVIAPILAGLGFSPLASVVIPSIGHGWAVSFGSLGSSFNALLAATGQPETTLAPPTAFFLGFVCIATGPMVVHAAKGWSAIKRLALPVFLIGLVMAVVQFLVVTNGPWYIGSFSGSIAGLLVGIPLAYYLRNNHIKESGKSENTPINFRTLLTAVSGYALLVIIILVVQLTPAVKSGLGTVSLETSFPELSTSLGFVTPAGPGRSIKIFSHTGTILLFAAILAYIVYRMAGLYEPGAVGRIAGGTLRRVMSSSVSIVSMVSMAVIMQHAGMTETLALGLAQTTGMIYPLIAPWIGALGAFMTGSNTNSNMVFGALQMRTAELLGYSVAIILGAQTSGAAVASIIAPTKVVVGASTAGMAGKEGDVIRKLLVYVGMLICLISILALLGIALLP